MRIPLLLGRTGTHGVFAPGLALCLAAATSAGAQTEAPGAPGGALSIEHEAPGCVRAEQYARLSACFRPEQALARGRLYFKAKDGAHWFYVEMTGDPPCLVGVLPRPRKGLAAIEYYVSGMDREFAESRTSPRALDVTRSDVCTAGPIAPVVESASVIIGSASGAAPAGFLVGGGISTGLAVGLVAGGAGAAAALVVATGGGGGQGPAPTTTTTTTLPPLPTTARTTTKTTTATTTLPACETAPPRWRIVARTEDSGGNTGDDPVAGILGERGCFRRGERSSERRASTWLSELGVPGGRGQVAVDGAQASFPGPGIAAQALALSPGPHRFEAVLVDAGGPGLWRFDLSLLGAAPGTLRVIAGEVAQLGPALVTFRMSGQPGERVVFSLRTGGE